MGFNFLRRLWKKDTQKLTLLSAKSWQFVDVIECDELPIKGSLVYLAKPGVYYEVVHVIHYADFDFRVLRKYLIVEPVPTELIKPF